MASFREFVATFWTVVRTDKGFSDGRPAFVKKFLTSPLANMLEMADLMEPHDFAVYFSGCVGVSNKPSADLVKKAQRAADLKKILDRLHSEDRLPLAADPLVAGAKEFLCKLLNSAKGMVVYRNLVVHLVQAIEEEGLRVYLYYPNGRPNFKKTAAATAEKDKIREPSDVFEQMTSLQASEDEETE